jgi:hypothetical protein
VLPRTRGIKGAPEPSGRAKRQRGLKREVKAGAELRGSSAVDVDDHEVQSAL